MEKIYIIDLSSETITEKPYDIIAEWDYGRGLAHRLLKEHTSLKADRHSPDNAIVIVPGLFAGCASPSSGRMTIATKSAKDDVKISNTAGNMPQLLGSLNICAVVIKGCYKKRNAVIHIGENGVELFNMPQLDGKYTTAIIAALKEEFGRDSAIAGTALAGDLLLPLSTMFNTYPDGTPEFNCPRSTQGDILGSKGLRAIVVNSKRFFDRSCADADAFRRAGKRLTKIILENDICSKALPAYGSVTLIHLLKNRDVFSQSVPQKVQDSDCNCSDKNNNKNDKKINYNCAPMCVIGCLNRHSANSGEVYDSPDESELAAILKEHFSIIDKDFLKILNRKLRDLCLDPLEFIAAVRCYFTAMDIVPAKDNIFALIDEIESGSKTGRLIGSRAKGVVAAFPDCNLQHLTGKKVIDEEKNFNVIINNRGGRFENISDLDMLYYQTFLLENLGICLFVAFALVNNDNALSLLAEMYKLKTGNNDITEDDLIFYAQKCINAEIEYLKENGQQNARAAIPEFTKVLYRYFSR